MSEKIQIDKNKEPYCIAALGCLIQRVRAGHIIKEIDSDVKSVQFKEAIDYEWGECSNVSGCFNVAIRTEIIDKAVADFIKNNPGAVVVNLGVGLCTRFYRIQEPSLVWIDVDHPYVIELRQKLLTQNISDHLFISSSIFDFNWINIVKQYNDRPKIFIAEGVLMEYPEKNIKDLFQMLAKEFPGSEILFEAISPPLQIFKIILRGKFYRWAISNAKDIEGWHNGIEFVEEWFQNDFRAHLFPYWKKVLNSFPLARKCGKIVHLRFK